MQPQRGLPPHPSLPSNPSLYHNPRNVSQGNASVHQQGTNIGAVVAQTLTSSLANPYGQTSSHHSYTNANYHSYFAQVQRPMTTVQGYTLSSTYVPITGGHSSIPQSHSWSRSERGRGIPNNLTTNRVSRPFTQNFSSVPGDCRCTHDGCSFTGSKKTVEIHMMDRHLIFPPGWKKKNSDWDADPSLKGKPVPIPGTGLTLDTPEALDAWIAERKKRWPSKQHVEDKKRKAQEAADRGEIDPSELTLKSRKRRKVDGELHGNEGRGRGRGRGRSLGRGRTDYARTDTGWQGRGRGGGGSTPSVRPNLISADDLRPQGHVDQGDSVSSSSDDPPLEESVSDSDSDMDPIKDAVSSKPTDPDLGPRISKENLDPESQQISEDGDPPVASALDLSNTVCRPLRRRKPAPQPRALPQNPFATRPSLLRSLLLPEIRHTVSNLSQAIHFLVENEFLEGVELKPGDADSQRIKVLESTRFADTSSEAGINAMQN